ncbi:ribosome maturation factor RimP [Arcobacter arenosus]|jgi:ribosome maturation factor RimP|uniref:Ribosome maturation factor RimP n=1 Tax=Arcobacter arenosus TaxID=2576037 RepID=A0A5R8Y5Y9_9BACT|nr:ribosome maturation factor RimP [Arcobacter arenosus]TLP41231.1 ribosome maturation factor RimP [Arcobacter arenosus]
MNLEESIEIAVQGCGAEIYDIVTLKENDKNIYRVYVTAKGGISLDKCAEISRMISPILDIEEPMQGNYNLEVSSPGIERKLKKPQHYKASIGEKVKLKDFNKDTVKGELIFADDNEIKIKTEHGEEIVTYDEISTASTYFEW